MMWLMTFGGSSASFTLTRDDVLNLVGYVTTHDYGITNVMTRVHVHVGAGLALTAEMVERIGA